MILCIWHWYFIPQISSLQKFSALCLSAIKYEFILFCTQKFIARKQRAKKYEFILYCTQKFIALKNLLHAKVYCTQKFIAHKIFLQAKVFCTLFLNNPWWACCEVSFLRIKWGITSKVMAHHSSTRTQLITNSGFHIY